MYVTFIHDIGNLDGREGHEKKLRLYFNRTNFKSIDVDHIKLISLIASKHGGMSVMLLVVEI